MGSISAELKQMGWNKDGQGWTSARNMSLQTKIANDWLDPTLVFSRRVHV